MHIQDMRFYEELMIIKVKKHWSFVKTLRIRAIKQCGVHCKAEVIMEMKICLFPFTWALYTNKF